MPVKLLFVDDEPKLQAVVEQLFRKEIHDGDYEIKFATSAIEAIDILRADPAIDILLTDLNMPKMNGLSLLSRLKENKGRFNPVLTPIVVTAYGDMDNIRRAMNAGAFDFLTKPIDFEDVRQTVAKAIVHVQRLKHAIEQEERAKKALRQLNQELERRVEERTAELQKSNAELNAFAHTVAHNLKNPLGIIHGYVADTIEFFDETEAAELFDMLTTLREQAHKSINIVDELLLLAGVRKMDPPSFPIDMRDLINAVLHRLDPMIREYQARIETPPEWLLASGYAPWVEEVWMNYLTNALKYGGSPPYLQLGNKPCDNGMICFWVKDNGQGIAPGDQPRLFTEFSRLTESRAHGHGLGLSIVRRIVEKLGGQVGVESQPGQGSRFYFSLPVANSIEL